MDIEDVYHVELTQKERAIVLHALNELPAKGEGGVGNVARSD